MTDFISEFLAAMRAAGFEPKGNIVADDKWHQATAPGDTKNWYSGTYSMKVVSADFAIGCFFSRKDPETKHKWHSKSDVKLSSSELKKINAEIEKQRIEKEEAEYARQKRISIRLTAYFKRQPKATNDHPYLKRKGIAAHNIRLRKKGNELIVPLYGVDGKIWSIQRITEEGRKYLFAGGRKQGSYFPLCTASECLDIFLVCEGFATGASVREATGLPVIVAFDSGNLKAVLIALKAKYPKAKFVICADNDAFTLNAKKEPWNVGIEKAHQAAEAIGGAFVVAPTIVNDKNTDFNDLQAATSCTEVERQILEVVKRVPALAPEAAAVDENLQVPDQHHGGGSEYSPEDYGERDYDYEAEAMNTDPLQGDFGMNFKVLGYNKGVYYYFPFKSRQIVPLTASAHTLSNLNRLDSLENWQSQFGADKANEKKIVMYATNALIQLAEHRGVFKEEDRVRGCGAWIDDGRKILHCGDVLYVDGHQMKFDQLQSEYTYIAAAKLMRPHPDPLSNKEANALRKICELVTWENPLSGALLAGWLVVAPVCGALEFRPHIYVTGESESGKSTVINRIIKPVLGRMSVNLDGGTTEPAIREVMEYDARPLVYDEAEKSIHMPAVIELSRKASTGASVKKFGQGRMIVRFCACFSAINPPVNKTADENRISFMTIRKNRRSTAMKEYEDLLELIRQTITPDYSSRMVSRTLANMDALFKNIAIFQRAARTVIKGARASELIGTMLAGLYLLGRTDVVTPEFAEKWIAQHDWTSHTIIDDDTDPMRLLQFLSSCILRYEVPGLSGRGMSIGDLIVLAHGRDATADKLLRHYGLAVKDGRLYVAGRSQHLEKVLKETDWSYKWSAMLANLPGAEKFQKPFYFGVGFKTSGVSLPISLFIEPELKPKNPEPTYDDQEEIPF